MRDRRERERENFHSGGRISSYVQFFERNAVARVDPIGSGENRENADTFAFPMQETITKVAGSKYRLERGGNGGYRFKIFIKKHNQSGTYGIGLLSNLRLTRPARNSMNLECSSHDSILKYVFVTTIARTRHGPDACVIKNVENQVFNKAFNLICRFHLLAWGNISLYPFSNLCTSLADFLYERRRKYILKILGSRRKLSRLKTSEAKNRVQRICVY